MKKSTKNIAAKMNLKPISVVSAIKLIIRGYKVGFCFGYKTKRKVHIWKTK